ncbi:hypothetical protein ZIOFF_008250 [Zingiber officinale]|uniref:Pre-mRNA-processing factor 19 n=1 Tax=Zingiber officinale TaxID=94328 RepID=A0A8J5IHX7_ZINOF|nr:hypothetical protein ZIOFF_008250 [Zingiber officinale]
MHWSAEQVRTFGPRMSIESVEKERLPERSLQNPTANPHLRWLSGEVPEEPVVSNKSGHLFERRLIEHHIASHGKCPVTKEELTMDDLVVVKINKVVKPRTLQAASIPGLLGMFHSVCILNPF